MTIASPTAAEVARLLAYDPLTGSFTWKITPGRRIRAGEPAGSKSPMGYWQIGVLGQTRSAARVAWLLSYGEWPEQDIDHINGNPLDNRLANLRACTRSENNQNRDERVVGAWFDERSGRWCAQIESRGVNYRLGYYSTKSEAQAAYRGAKRVAHRFSPELRPLQSEAA